MKKRSKGTERESPRKGRQVPVGWPPGKPFDPRKAAGGSVLGRTGRPGEVYIPTIGVRKLTDMDQKPLYCRVVVPPRVAKDTVLPLFVPTVNPDLMGTNIPFGDRLSVGAEAVIYRIRIGLSPEASLAMGDIMGVLSAGVLELGFGGPHEVAVRGGLMFYPFSLFPGVDPAELTELYESDKRMGLKGGKFVDPPPERILERFYDPARRGIPIHISASDGPQFHGNVTFELQGKNDSAVRLYAILDSFLILPLR